MMKTTL